MTSTRKGQLIIVSDRRCTAGEPTRTRSPVWMSMQYAKPKACRCKWYASLLIGSSANVPKTSVSTAVAASHAVGVMGCELSVVCATPASARSPSASKTTMSGQHVSLRLRTPAGDWPSSPSVSSSVSVSSWLSSS